MSFELTHKSVLSQLELLDTEARNQVQSWSRSSRIAAISGLVMIGIGGIAAIFGQTTEGIFTSVSSIIPESVAGLFFVQLRAANKRVDTIQERLNDTRTILIHFDIADSMENPAERDQMKAEIIRKFTSI